MTNGLLRQVDAVTIKMPNLEAGLDFYSATLGHELRWWNVAIGQAGLGVPESTTEIVVTTEHGYEPNWLVESAADALGCRRYERAGCPECVGSAIGT